ncbi:MULTISPECIES: sugar O-acetyltransferase [unclassified Leptolyngbya]|uniref:sugar O-acetyltransferase n=1 Tax=unclassified Leptolyngbya TaxID=2650499 RepID=UPI0016825A1A|nr:MULTISPECIES: sugar O-acetyltransferase [unclassified Leptolyngbya]MBD1914255.1 sugar O-acetyltransferase [Leptolyngbya sp. FACHB-8]MBD2157262.1 sugar O-acetyltransferase [Leptolyngbya sp. FACHB-16]
MSTEKEKMLAGELYLASDPELVTERTHARRLMYEYNLSSPDDGEGRSSLLQQLLGHCGNNVWIEPPFYCDYGINIHFEDGVYLNFNCVLLDCAPIHIGANTLIAPAVQIYTAYHPTDPATRTTGLELAAPITIGKNVWIGGGAIICPGVTIGDNTTIGAGSVVAKSIPSGVIAVGNPCRVVREIG